MSFDPVIGTRSSLVNNLLHAYVIQLCFAFLQNLSICHMLLNFTQHSFQSLPKIYQVYIMCLADKIMNRKDTMYLKVV